MLKLAQSDAYICPCCGKKNQQLTDYKIKFNILWADCECKSTKMLNPRSLTLDSYVKYLEERGPKQPDGGYGKVFD